MKIRTHLTMLALRVLLPMTGVAVLATVVMAMEERELLEREAVGRARAAMSAVDAALRGHVETASSMGASNHLDSGDFRAFHEESRRILAIQPRWLNVGLTSTDGEQRSDAVLPFSDAFPAPRDLDTIDVVARTGKPAFGDVAYGAAIRMSTVRVRVPIVRGDTVQYVLSVPLNLELFDEVLQAQRLPDGWVIAPVDRNHRFIARIPRAPVGASISESFRSALERAPEGWFREAHPGRGRKIGRRIELIQRIKNVM